MNPKKNIEIIKQFNLSPHPEGGWFREIVRSENSLIREDGQIRNISNLKTTQNKLKFSKTKRK